MLLKDIKPSSFLRKYVQCYRIVHFDFIATDTIPYKLYPPKPENCLHFFLQDDFAIATPGGQRSRQPMALFTGQQTSAVKQFNGRKFLDVQIVFQPSAIFNLTGIHAEQLTNQFLDGTLIFSKILIMQLFDRLEAAADYADMIRLLELFVYELAENCKIQCHPIDDIITDLRSAKIEGDTPMLARASYLSTKQFERKFVERTGVTPKTFSRLVRFNQVFNLRNRFPDRDWLSIAVACNYFDYQHLVRDYKQFSGLGPMELHKLENNSPECVLGIAKELYKSRVSVM